MKSIAVIGSGISGMAAAYLLSRRYSVALFEKDDRIGGHTHTHRIDADGGTVAIDSGFIVHNDRTYPNLVRLLRELKVSTEMSDMSFSVTDRRSGLEYSSRGLQGFFAQTGGDWMGHAGLLGEIVRFNRNARRELRRMDSGQAAWDDAPLSEFLRFGRYSRRFVDLYLVPMASAVWSSSTQDINRFPVATLLRFFNNHGLLGLRTQPQWKVIRGGSARYIEPLTAPYRHAIRTGLRNIAVTRDAAGITIRGADLQPRRFDEVVFACPAAEALRLIEGRTLREEQVLGDFQTVANDAVLHRDARLLPTRPRARASWNYRLGSASSQRATVTYHMNRLQNLDLSEDYCVSLNEDRDIDPKRVLRQMTYHHPLYAVSSIRAQSRWDRISGHNHTHFCGAYWGNGFHEDGLNSAIRVAKSLGVEW